MLSLDEAISLARARADKAKERESLFLRDDLIYLAKEEYRLAEEHEQLAERLEELKAIKSDGFTDDLLNMGFSKGYRKALDDFVNACKENILCKTFGLRECDIEKIAEQLKVGV